MNKLKILMLTPYLPYPLLSGGQIRTYNLLKQLADTYDITLFALIKEDSERQYLPELEKYCHQVRVFKRSKKPFTLRNILKTAFSSYPFLAIRNYVPELKRAIEQELKEKTYDVIHAETFYMMPHLPQTSVPVMLVEQTIEYLGYESFAKGTKWKILQPLLQVDVSKIQTWEEHYWRSCDRLVTMSQEDRAFIGQAIGNMDKIDVVSNGVDTAWFAAKPQRLPAVPTLLSVGTFHWLPNVEAVRFLVKEVWPLVKAAVPGVKLWIVGNAPTKEVFGYQQHDTAITITGGIPDIRDAFTQAHVLVAPVFSGKGTRYKILEAMAAGTPIVASSIAVEGLSVRNGEEVLIGDTAVEMADLTTKLISDPELQKRLAANGRKFVQATYDWKLIAQQLNSAYRKMSREDHHAQ